MDKAEIFIDILENSTDLPYTVLDNKYQIVKSNTPDNMMLIFFAMDNIKLNASPNNIPDILEEGPQVFTNSIGMSFITDWILKDNEIYRIYILGPVFMDDYTTEVLSNKLNNITFSVAMKREFLEIIKQVPVVTMNRFLEYGIMLRYVLTGQRVGIYDFVFTKKEPDSKDGDKWGVEDRHGTYLTECKLLQCVEEGNLNYKECVNSIRIFEDGLHLKLKNYLRKGKDILIAAIILVSRAAIKGGLSSEMAYILCENYIHDVEAAGEIDKLHEIHVSMLEDFALRVHRIKENGNITPQIRSACDYISINLDKRIEIHELARKYGYTDYYFSDKFKKETGVSVKQFIKDKKMERAKELLKNTNLDVVEISSQLGFATQSYFGDVFKKTTGSSPGQYRELFNKHN